MKLCRDIYLRTDEEAIKVSIAKALMTRIKDIDSAVSVRSHIPYAPILESYLTLHRSLQEKPLKRSGFLHYTHMWKTMKEKRFH